MTHEEIKSAIERLEKLCEEKSYLAYDVMRAIIGKDFPDLYNNIGTLKDLLQQADPDTHMELPVDADGEVIHVGDVIVMEDGTTVYALAVNGSDFAYNYGCAVAITQAHNKHHYHKPTVEDVLREMLEKAVGFSDAHTTVALNAVAEYASKLRKVMADDDAR